MDKKFVYIYFCYVFTYVPILFIIEENKINQAHVQVSVAVDIAQQTVNRKKRYTVELQ